MITPSILYIFLLFLLLSSVYSFYKKNTRQRELFKGIEFTQVILSRPLNDTSDIQNYVTGIHIPQPYSKDKMRKALTKSPKFVRPHEGMISCNYPFQGVSVSKPIFY